MLPRSMLSTLLEVQREILSFDRFEATADWVAAIGRRLAPVMRTELAYYVGPNDAPAVTGGDSVGAIEVYAPQLDSAFERGIEDDFVGFADAGHSIFSERYSTTLHQLTFAAGPAAIHDEPLFDEANRRSMRLQAEVFDRVGIERQLALSVPQTRGEALLIFGYDGSSVPELGSEAHAALELLLPAYREALALRRAQSNWRELIPAFDALPVATAFVSEADFVVNRALSALAPPVQQELLEACQTLGRSLLTAAVQRREPARHGTSYVVSLGARGIDYRLSARLIEGLPKLATLVQVERTQSVPPAEALRRHFSLTSREGEVANLIVQRFSDKEIAARLSIRYHTARQHVARVLAKVGVARDGLEAALWQAFFRDGTR
ncbi:MAG: helix-turn-helix transcriptional regulator [Myxococcota bacterium]